MHEGHPVDWSKFPSFLLPAEKQLSSAELRKRAREAFKQRQAQPDPEIHAQTVHKSLTELQKIRDILAKEDR